MKLAIFFNHKKLSGYLTKFFTGCYAYHTAWVDLDNDLIYDMNLLRRRRTWSSCEYTEDEYLLFEIPKVTKEYLESMLTSDNSEYGYMDYILFSLRGLYHLLGLSTPNKEGEICSEMCNNDIWNCGGETPFEKTGAPPSPCDLYSWIKNK